MTVLPDGRTVTLNLGDGMASRYDGLDQSSEDFVSIDKEIYRLDLTRMHSEDNRKYVAEKRFTTAEETIHHKRKFPHNNCDIYFSPVIPNSDQSMVEDGVNVGLVSFKQFLIYGHFSGHCNLTDKDGKPFKVDIKHVYGHVEYVFSRW